MRHRKKTGKLSRTSAHRKAMPEVTDAVTDCVRGVWLHDLNDIDFASRQLISRFDKIVTFAEAEAPAEIGCRIRRPSPSALATRTPFRGRPTEVYRQKAISITGRSNTTWNERSTT